MVSIFLPIITTIASVFLAFKLENWRRKKVDKKDFKSSLRTLDFEMEQNLSLIKKFRENVTEKKFHYGSLVSNTLDLLLLKNTTVQFGGEVIYLALNATNTRINSFTKLYDRTESHAYISKGLNKETIDRFRDCLNQTEFIIVLSRTLIRKYEQNPKLLPQKGTLDNLSKCLELEKHYRAENLPTAYKRLMEDCQL